MTPDVSHIHGIADRLDIRPRLESHSKCLIIGGSPSLIGCGRGWYVDNFVGDVIRINEPAQPMHVNDIGSRTDVLFTSKWMDKNIYRSKSCKKVVIDMDDTMSLSKQFYGDSGFFLSTGMLCILLCLSAYDHVEVIGFGDVGSHASDRYLSTHLDPRKLMENTSQCPHDMHKEHVILNDLSQKDFKGKIIMLDSENVRPELSLCWDRFKRKTVVSFTGNKFSRIPSLIHETRRVGMSGVEVQWQYPSPLNDLFMNSMRHIKEIENNGYFNVTMGHYRAIATAYHLGCSEAIIM